VLRHLARVHPQLAEAGMVRRTASWSWDKPSVQQRRVRLVPARASTTRCTATSSRPEGRIFFAGEHASLTHTWMQGALESGLRATRELHRSARKRPSGRRRRLSSSGFCSIGSVLMRSYSAITCAPNAARSRRSRGSAAPTIAVVSGAVHGAHLRQRVEVPHQHVTRDLPQHRRRDAATSACRHDSRPTGITR
jgi:hypothetical protein